MVFLRELCQNARDARATAIRVTTHREGNQLDIAFEDNGHGMTFDHAKRFLFTLYASSKEQERDSAGRFGVGFWSVLLSNPETITISSMPIKGTPWRIRMDGDLQSLREIAPDIKAVGTKIVVTYLDVDDAEAIQRETEAETALKRYCRYLRRADRVDAPLPLSFNATRIDQPMMLDSPCWMSFRGKDIEGAVGVTDTPGVEIYARGLPVWQGTVLEELRYGAKRRTPMQLPKGFAPSYLINGHRLNVTYDRRAVVDDRALRRLRRSAKIKMDELLRRYLDQISPRPIHVRFLDSLKRGARTLYMERRFPSVLVLLLLSAALVVYLIPDRSDGPAAVTLMPAAPNVAAVPVTSGYRPLGNPLDYKGPTTELQSMQRRLGLIYLPKIDIAFRIAAMETLDDTAGIIASPSRIIGLAPPFSCQSDCIDVAIPIQAHPGPVVLPAPTGYAVSPSSLRLGNTPAPLYLSDKDEPVIRLTSPVTSHLTYRTGPISTSPSQARRAALRHIPADIAPPPPLQHIIERVVAIDEKGPRIAAAVAQIEQAVSYDASPSVSVQYDRFIEQHGPKHWMRFVFGLGRGDCDVKNTLLVYVFRRLGIPARLAVGPVGRDGAATALMHAWVEYFDNGWRVADATGSATADSPVAVDTGRPTAPLAALPEPPLAPTAAPPRFRPAPDMSVDIDTVEWGEVAPSLDRRGVARIIFGAALGLGALLVLFALFISGKSGTMSTPADPTDQQTVAAKIAAGALAFPEWWNLGDTLRNRPLIPCLTRHGPLSLREAESLAEKGRLFVAERPSAWLDRASRHGAVVMDGKADIYRQIGSLLPAATSLDAIDALALCPAKKLAPKLAPVRKLAEAVNTVIRAAGIRDAAVALALNPEVRVIQDLDLGALGVRPPHQIVVPHRHPVFATSGPSQRRDTAVFDAVDTISKESEILSPHRARLVKAAAARVFGVSS